MEKVDCHFLSFSVKAFYLADQKKKQSVFDLGPLVSQMSWVEEKGEMKLIGYRKRIWKFKSKNWNGDSFWNVWNDLQSMALHIKLKGE